MTQILVIGGGLAAATAVTELRANGFAGDITLLAGEMHPPYERPPLSKSILLGEKPPSSATVHPLSWYDDHDVSLHLGRPADRIDRAAKQVSAGAQSFGYDRLLIATGARPRPLPLADSSGAPLSYLRTVDDAVALRSLFRPGLRLGIIGGGWIGLEVAAAARSAEVAVTVLEVAELPLLGVMGPEVAQVFADLHRSHGVTLVTGAQISSISAAGVVSLSSGTDLAFDHLVVGIGVLPNDALASEAGLAVDNGIRVSASLRTSDPSIFAAGDVACVDHPVLGRPIRVEHWDTSIQHGKVAAANLAGGSALADALPYFFTDQYDLGMEYVGTTLGGYDRVILRGDIPAQVFTAWWLSGDRVVAGMHVNDWDAMADVRRLVGSSVDAAALAAVASLTDVTADN